MACPAVQVYHVGGGTLPNNTPRKLFFNFRNSLFMLYKNLPDDQFKRKFFVRLLLDGIAAFMFLLTFQFGFFMAVIRAHTAFWKQLGALKKKRIEVKKLHAPGPRFRLSNNFILVDFFIKNKKTFDQLQI
jgi:hypothetical protein